MAPISVSSSFYVRWRIHSQRCQIPIQSKLTQSQPLARFYSEQALPIYPTLPSSMNACKLALLLPLSPATLSQRKRFRELKGFFKSVDFSATRMMMTVPLTHPFAFSPVHLRPLLQHLRDSHGEHVVDLILLLAEPLPQQITLFSYSDRWGVSISVAIRVDLNYDSEAYLKVSSHARFFKCFPRRCCWQSFIKFPTALSKLRSFVRSKREIKKKKKKKIEMNWFDIEIVSDLWEH